MYVVDTTVQEGEGDGGYDIDFSDGGNFLSIRYCSEQPWPWPWFTA